MDRSNECLPHLAGQWIELSERISVCSRLLRNMIAEYCRKPGLGDTQVSVLWACMTSPTGGWAQTDLARLLVVSPAHISGLVEQSRRQGLLCGHRSVHDRRRQHWQLTPLGRTQLQLLMNHLAGLRVQLDPQFDPNDLLMLIRRLNTALSDSPALGHDSSEAPSEKMTEKPSAARPAQQRGAA
jgi:DNA-binding MarR family transcriptional regulator